jgi:exonuclease VII small subunit
MGEAVEAVKGSGRDSAVEAEVDAMSGLDREMDRLSLEQALRDFEIANARVIDLTRRLLEANDQIRSLQGQAEAASMRSVIWVQPFSTFKQSPLGRLAKRLRDLLRSLRS